MKRLFLSMAAIASLIMATGCDNETDLNTKINNLPVQSAQFLSTSYGSAKIVDVDNGREYIEVEIVENGVERNVYFTHDGNWVMTSTDVAVRNLPDAVTAAVAASEYGSWRIDDADMVENADGTFYVVEVEDPASEREVKLKIAADGSILA